MSVDFFSFISQVFSNPLLAVTTILTLGEIFVNGLADAPNAITTCVSTRCMKPKHAIIMASVFIFLGVFVMTTFNAGVANTIFHMVDFGTDTHKAIIALCAALVSIVLWVTLAWKFGIPTSESHALIAGLSGAAISIQGDLSAINFSEWIKVIYGLGVSVFLGFFAGLICAKCTQGICRNADRPKANFFFRKAQIAGGAAMSFMHGAQDGQKFMSIFLLGMFLSKGQKVDNFVIPIWLMVMCSAVMAIGTAVGGKKIIKSVGSSMVKLEVYQGFSADLGATICLFFSSITGIPVSTTQTKTTSIMGVGASKRLSSVNLNVVKNMVLAWLFTFPGCGLLGYLMAKLFMLIF